MSVPRCPECSASIPMRGSFSTSAKVPVNRTCAGCEELLPDYLFGETKPTRPPKESRHERLMRALRG